MLLAATIGVMGVLGTSCVEDEKNPYENIEDGTASGSAFNVMLPGMGTFYVGSEIELRGSGFSSGDEIYVSDFYDSSSSVKARITSYTADKLFFIMPAGVVEYGGNVEVSLVRNGEWHTLGGLYVNNYSCTSMPLENDIYGELVEIMGEYADGDKAYYQEYNYDGELLGEPIELDLKLKNSDYDYNEVIQTSTFYPLFDNYLFIYEHNGETAIKQEMPRLGTQLMIEQSASIGETVSIEWPGFKNGDKILLAPNGSENATLINNPVIAEDMLSFEVPSAGSDEIISFYQILLLRYEGYVSNIGYLNIIN